ncbi:LicD family protein [[Clostridium] aminophilum]|uniref:LicD family protein n=1 Tax=[Clostridium] aminophilum TaxID=1526 RepID=UPI00332EA3AB
MQQKFDLTAVHAANLKMLKEIDRICRKYRIRYFLDAGTLLGAIRHKGFIPWDDDVDIAMPRRDYERFLRIAKEELPAGIDLLRPEDFRGGTAFYDFTARIIYQNSRRYPDNEETRFYEGKLNHLWIDIFTMDRIPDNPVLDRLSRLSQKIVYGLAMGHRRELDYSKYSAADRIRVKILAGIGKRIPMKMIFGLQRRAASFWNFRKNTRHLYFTNYAPDWMYCTAESSWFRESVDVPFEDTVLSAAAGYEPMLRQLYGDYRKLPPEEKRVPEHSDFTFWE